MDYKRLWVIRVGFGWNFGFGRSWKVWFIMKYGLLDVWVKGISTVSFLYDFLKMDLPVERNRNRFTQLTLVYRTSRTSCKIKSTDRIWCSQNSTTAQVLPPKACRCVLGSLPTSWANVESVQKIGGKRETSCGLLISNISGIPASPAQDYLKLHYNLDSTTPVRIFFASRSHR
jgi:hypothetical protein